MLDFYDFPDEILDNSLFHTPLVCLSISSQSIMPSHSNLQDSNMGAGPSTEAPTETQASLQIAPALLSRSLTEFTLEGQMSPCTVATTLAQFPNLDSNVLRGICKGLCQTLEFRATDHVEQTRALQDRIQTLESTLQDRTNDHETLAKTLQECVEILEQQLDRTIHPSPDNAPEGFSLNDGQYPMLYITVAPREMQPVYWIQETSDGKVLSRYRGQPVNKDPWVFKVYVQPLLELEYPITTNPSWYRHLALGPSAGFAMLAEATAAAGHLGLLAEVLRWQHLDEQLQGTHTKLKALEGDILALQSNMGLCESRLVSAQAHQHVLTLENVGKSGARQYYATLRTTKKGMKQGHFV
jgi:hypothetical protein